MAIDIDKLGWPYKCLKSHDHLGWLYRNANKPRPPVNWRRQALFSFIYVALIQLGGNAPWWIWGASAPWRILGIWTIAIAFGILWYWASRRGFFYLANGATDELGDRD